MSPYQPAGTIAHGAFGCDQGNFIINGMWRQHMLFSGTLLIPNITSFVRYVETFHITSMLVPLPMELSAATKKTLSYSKCGGNTCSLPGPYPIAGYTDVHDFRMLSRKLLTLPECWYRCPLSFLLQPRKRFHTGIVAASHAHFRDPTQ